jgi:hypothetical protein
MIGEGDVKRSKLRPLLSGDGTGKQAQNSNNNEPAYGELSTGECKHGPILLRDFWVLILARKI